MTTSRSKEREALINIQREAEGMRMWGGMGWTWHHFRAKRIHDICTAALKDVPKEGRPDTPEGELERLGADPSKLRAEFALLPGLREALKWKPNTPQLENAMTYAWEQSIKSFIRAIEKNASLVPSETGLTVDRWEVNIINRPNDYAELKHRKSQTGQWVTYDDHCRALAALSAKGASE
jgi:hypothetical protein